MTTTIIILAVVSLSIVILYAAALLVFTPYEEDDKVLLKVMESGLKFHDSSLKKPGIISYIEEGIAKFILLIAYYILKDRKYIDEVKEKPIKK